MGHIRDMNGGRDYDPLWSRGSDVKGDYSKLIMQRYRMARKRLGLGHGRDRVPLNHNLFRVPQSVSGQGDLFG